jgi:Multicopper oxidase
MAIRNIYLKIERIFDYSPVRPDEHVTPPIQYGRDCMRNMGHEDGLIPDDEINGRRVTALIYREYIDASYFVPKPDKLVDADINEPAFTRRVPGTVIYVRPGNRLRIHVKNADIVPHSFHLHGLKYGIDSDGSWPFGTQSSDGRRSDEICPGQKWTYTFDATEATIGAWPFHDHCRNIGTYINRGLFGAIVVLRRQDHDDDLPCFDLPEGLVKLLKKHEGKKDGSGGGDRGHGGKHSSMQMTSVRMTHAAMGPAAVMEMPGMPGMGGGGVPAFMPPRHAHGPDLSDVPEPFRPFIVLLDEIARVPRHEVSSKRRKTLHVPMFLHQMSGARGTPVFQSAPLNLTIRRSSTTRCSLSAV